jgi:hypothetical protein
VGTQAADGSAAGGRGILAHSPTLAHPLAPLSHPLTHPLTYSPAHSLAYSLTRSLAHAHSHSLTQSPALAHSLECEATAPRVCLGVEARRVPHDGHLPHLHLHVVVPGGEAFRGEASRTQRTHAPTRTTTAKSATKTTTATKNKNTNNNKTNNNSRSSTDRTHLSRNFFSSSCRSLPSMRASRCRWFLGSAACVFFSEI